MTDAVLAHYRRVWDAMTDDAQLAGLPHNKPDKTKALVVAFVVHAVLDQRAIANVVTQWEIDADSVIEQSLAELSGFKACLPGFLDTQTAGMPANVREAFGALADYFDDVASGGADAREGIGLLWRDIIPQLRAYGDGHG